MFANPGVPTLRCQFAGAHTVLSERMVLESARLREWLRIWQDADAEAHYWHDVGDEDLARTFGPDGLDPLLADWGYLAFVGRESTTGRPIAVVSVSRGDDGAYRLGALVDREFRGQGYGREAVELVCRVAHQHFGIADLWAGCESTNEAARRTLAASGFVLTDESAPHVLPNGRLVESCWWRRSDPGATRRCRTLRED